MTAMQDGLLCRYFHAGDGSPLATLSTPGPKAVEVRDTSGKREAQYLWNPETGALASAPIFEPNIAPSPYLQGNGYLTTEDRAHVLTQQSDGMTRDWSLHSVTMAGSKTIASGRNDEGFDAAYVSVDHDLILFRHPLSTHMRATSLDGKLKCQWWTGGTMDEVLSSCDFKHLFRLGQTGIWRDRLVPTIADARNVIR